MEINQNFNIIILNWNGWDDTKLCIESILKESKFDNFTIFLVDNGSSDKEINIIEKYLNSTINNVIIETKETLKYSNCLNVNFKNLSGKNKIVFVKNNDNLGFAKGNNIVLKFLIENNQKYALLLNNDTIIENDALCKMYNYLVKKNTVNDEICAIIPQIRLFEPNNILWNCGGSINWLGIRKYYYANKDFHELPKDRFSSQVEFGTGCCILMDLDKTGILSNKYFFGEEDFEFALRMRKSYKIVCLYDSIIYHKVGTSRDKVSEIKLGKLAYHYSQRMNNLKIHLNYFSWLISFFLHFLSSLRIALKDNSLLSILKMWKIIYRNSNKERFTKEDFIIISKMDFK